LPRSQTGSWLMDREYDWLMQSDVANATVVIIAGSMHLRPGRGRRGAGSGGDCPPPTRPSCESCFIHPPKSSTSRRQSDNSTQPEAPIKRARLGFSQKIEQEGSSAFLPALGALCRPRSPCFVGVTTPRRGLSSILAAAACVTGCRGWPSCSLIP